MGEDHYDGHTLGAVIEETPALTGVEVERAYVDKGYRGHNASKPLRIYRSGQKRGVHGQIKRELRRLATIEPVIGYMKSEGHLGRNYLKGLRSNRAKASAIESAQSSPPQGTTSASSSGGSGHFCAQSSPPSSEPSCPNQCSKQLDNGRRRIVRTPTL